MRFLILASLVLHSSLTLASPDKPGRGITLNRAALRELTRNADAVLG